MNVQSLHIRSAIPPKSDSEAKVVIVNIKTNVVVQGQIRPAFSDKRLDIGHVL